MEVCYIGKKKKRKQNCSLEASILHVYNDILDSTDTMLTTETLLDKGIILSKRYPGKTNFCLSEDLNM